MTTCPPPPTTYDHEDANSQSSSSPFIPLKSLVWMKKMFCGRRDCQKCNSEMQKQKHCFSQKDEDFIRTISIEDDSRLLECMMASCGCLKYPTQSLSLKNRYSSSSAISSNSSSGEQDTKKVVHWGSIAIHTHAYMLGDNPSVCFGPPVTIAWDAMESDTFPIDEFERRKTACPPRQRLEMVLPSRRREDLLIRDGYARSEMRAAVREAQRIRERRARSARDCTTPSELLHHLLHLSMPRSGDHASTRLIKPARSTAVTPHYYYHHHHHRDQDHPVDDKASLLITI